MRYFFLIIFVAFGYPLQASEITFSELAKNAKADCKTKFINAREGWDEDGWSEPELERRNNLFGEVLTEFEVDFGNVLSRTGNDTLMVVPMGPILKHLDFYPLEDSRYGFFGGFTINPPPPGKHVKFFAMNKYGQFSFRLMSAPAIFFIDVFGSCKIRK